MSGRMIKAGMQTLERIKQSFFQLDEKETTKEK
jgi:hypothetical protein